MPARSGPFWRGVLFHIEWHVVPTLWGGYKTLDDFVRHEKNGFAGTDHPSVLDDGAREHHISSLRDIVDGFCILGYGDHRVLEGDVYYYAHAEGIDALSDLRAQRTARLDPARKSRIVWA
jgi:hypothetical protein